VECWIIDNVKNYLTVQKDINRVTSNTISYTSSSSEEETEPFGVSTSRALYYPSPLDNISISVVSSSPTIENVSMGNYEENNFYANTSSECLSHSCNLFNSYSFTTSKELYLSSTNCIIPNKSEEIEATNELFIAELISWHFKNYTSHAALSAMPDIWKKFTHFNLSSDSRTLGIIVIMVYLRQLNVLYLLKKLK